MAKKLISTKRRVHFKPDNIDIAVERGANLLEIANQAGLRLIAACGGAGTCGTCKVFIEEGEVGSTRTEKLTNEEYEQGLKQACQSKVITDLTVHIPVVSRLETMVLAHENKGVMTDKHQPQVLATGWRFNPPLSKLFLELPSPTGKDNISDLSRMLRSLKQQYKLRNMTVDFDVVKKLPKALRDNDWRVTITTLLATIESHTIEGHRPRVINVEPGDTKGKHYSLACDIGTTAVKGQLLDLKKGTVITESADYNRQISYGADVITRIVYCQKPGGLQKLQQAVVTTINEIIKQLINQSHIDIECIGHLTFTGNTTMIQILLGLDPKYIRLAPYIPVATYIPPTKARSLGIKVGEHVYLSTFPSVSSYVGGDIVSGVLASGMYQRGKITLYMDIGTNGEIVIGNSDWMVTAACSAGPAFEGGGVKHGMIATNGAIEEFDINPSNLESTIGTIGGEKPKGICGSGLINIIVGLLETGIISQNGKFNTDLPTENVREGSDGYEYILAKAANTQIGKDIVITETDIDNIIRAKAAIYAGCQTLVKSVGITCHDIEQVIIAGAFGSHIDIEKAITIGLLPELPLDRFIFIGNGSLLGARLASFSTDMLDDARRVAEIMTNFELSESNDFMNNYVAALFLPHTNIDEFPLAVKRLEKLMDNQLKGGVVV